MAEPTTIRSPRISRPEWICLLVICGLGLVLRLSAAYWWHLGAESDRPAEIFRFGDSLSYWVLATQVANGQPYQYGGPDGSIFRAPLLPLVLAPVTWIPSAPQAILAARVIGGVLGSLSILLVALLGRRLGGVRVGLLAALLAACYPSAIGMSVLILSEMLFIPLMLGHLLLWQRAWLAPDLRSCGRWSGLGGVVAGLAVLTRPSWLLFLPFTLGVGLLVGPDRRRHIMIFLAMVCGLSLVMSPWWIRNAMITGRFVPTTLQVGPSLYDGLNPRATGASDQGMEFMREIFVAQQEADANNPRQPVSTLEYRVNRRAQRLAIEWARTNPWQVLRLAAMKFLRSWAVWPDGDGVASNWQKAIISLGTFGVLMLAIAGTYWRFSQLGWSLAICWLPCLYFTSLHMVFVGSIRYREPAMVVLIAVAATGLATFLGHRLRLPFPTDESTSQCLAAAKSSTD